MDDPAERVKATNAHTGRLPDAAYVAHHGTELSLPSNTRRALARAARSRRDPAGVTWRKIVRAPSMGRFRLGSRGTLHFGAGP